MTRVIRLHLRQFILHFYPVLQLQCNNLPHENCNNLPQGGIFFFTRSTCQSNTNAHNAEIIPSIYSTGILHLHNLSLSRCSWITFGTR